MRRTINALVSLAYALGFAGLSSGEEPGAVLPVEQFTRYDEFVSPKLSPDGSHIAYMTGKYGHSALAVIDTKDRKLVGGVRCPDGFQIFDFDWKSDARIVYQLAQRQPGKVQPTPTGEMEAVDLDGKSRSAIYGYRVGEMQTGTNLRVKQSSFASAEIVSPLLSDDKNILIAEYPWREGVGAWYFDPDVKPTVFRLNVYNGQKRRVDLVPLANASVLVDANDAVRFAVGTDEHSKSAVVWRPDPKAAWQAFELPDLEAESVIPRMFTDDDRGVYLTGVRRGESVTALYKLEIGTRALTRVAGADGVDISSIVTDLSGRQLIGVVAGIDKPQFHWLDAASRPAKIHRALIKAFPGQIPTVISASRDGSRAIVFVRSDVNPGDYYLLDPQTMSLDHLFSASRWIDPGKMHGKEPFVVKARDGVELHGYLTRPGAAGPHPLVVLPHGGPHGVRDDWSYDWEVQLLANRGYAVLQVNFRGSGGFGEDFEASGFHEWGARMQDDLTDATRWAIANKVAPPDRICIFGASYGGYAALMGAVREPDLYRCAVGYAGVYDLELMMSTGDVPRSRTGRAFLSVALGHDAAQLKARSPVNHASDIRIPVLLIHGKQDWRADFDQAKAMKAALESSRKAYEWMELRGEGHGVYDEETRREVYQRILEFLGRHLQAGTGAPTGR
jgi:dipeptidyl aminopeptidase/acylaminoacyl peptidase